jgi:hypothetical protein
MIHVEGQHEKVDFCCFKVKDRRRCCMDEAGSKDCCPFAMKPIGERVCCGALNNFLHKNLWKIDFYLKQLLLY